MVSRPTPFDLIFGPLADQRFPALQAAVERDRRDLRDRDHFVLVREVVEFLGELRPDQGLGEAMDEFVAFVHASFLFWVDGRSVVGVGRETLEQLTTARWAARVSAGERTFYLQLPAQRVWGSPIDDGPPEPLDGAFVSRHRSGLAVVAVFGLYPGRDGLTVVDARGIRPRELQRPDGSPLFGPLIDGGSVAGLFGVSGPEELLELAGRAGDLLGVDGPRPGWQEVSLL